MNFLKTDLISRDHEDSKNIYNIVVQKNFSELGSKGTVEFFVTVMKNLLRSLCFGKTNSSVHQ